MIVKCYLLVHIKAKCIKPSDDSDFRLKHDLEVGKLYEVEDIQMGDCYTEVYINDKPYNSVYLEFYYKNKLIDIYKSPLFNPWLNKPLKSWIKVVK